MDDGDGPVAAISSDTIIPPVNIFICWSGRRGHHVANAMKAWLEERFSGAVRARVSTDIEKGAVWRDELERDLQDAQVGLLCITPEALSSSWVHYEAGVMARMFTRKGAPAGRLYTFLLGTSELELNGPLSAFQSTNGEDERDTLRLIRGLVPPEYLSDRKSNADSEQDMVSERKGDCRSEGWEGHWRRLRQRLAVIPHPTLREMHPTFSDLFRRMTFEEPIDACLSQEWLARYCGVRDTVQALQQCRPRLERACRGYVKELLHALETELVGYGMAVSELVTRGRFELGERGQLEIRPPGLGVACEQRRCRVRRLVSRVEEPPPFFNESVSFFCAETVEEAKNIIHRVRPRVLALARALPAARPKTWEAWPERAACFTLLRDSLESKLEPVQDGGRAVDLELHWRTSSWDFDRVMYAELLAAQLALVQSRAPDATRASEASSLFQGALVHADEQLDLLRAQVLDTVGGALSPVAQSTRLMPLQCALSALESRCEEMPSERERLLRIVRDALELLARGAEQHRPARRIAKRLRRRLCPEAANDGT